MLARRSLFSAIAALLLTSPALSDSIPIPIPNGSFETPYVANAPPYASAGLSSWQKSPAPAWWIASGYTSAQWNNSVGTFVNVSYDWIHKSIGAPGGFHVFYSRPGNLPTTDQHLPGRHIVPTHRGYRRWRLWHGAGCPMAIGLYYLDGGGNQVMVGTTTVLNDNTSPTGDIRHLPDRQLTIPPVAASNPWAGKRHRRCAAPDGNLCE